MSAAEPVTPVELIVPGPTASGTVRAVDESGSEQEISVEAFAASLAAGLAVAAVPGLSAFARWAAATARPSTWPATLAALTGAARAGRLLSLDAAEGLADARSRAAVVRKKLGWGGSLDLGGAAGRARQALDTLGPANRPSTSGTATGPLGLWVRSRAEFAAGLVRADRLRPRPEAAADLAGQLAAVERQAFHDLVGRYEAAQTFRGGRSCRPNHRGFRPVNDGALGGWLSGQRERVIDRHGLPVFLSRLSSGGREPDPDLRNWPAWELASDPLTTAWERQVAERLARGVGPGSRGPLSSRFAGWPAVRCGGVDLFSHRRLRLLHPELPPAFESACGRRLARLGFPDLPYAALVSHLATSRTPPGPHTLGVLAATGLGDAGVAALARASGAATPAAAQLRAFESSLPAGWPELHAHLADPTGDALAGRFGVGPGAFAALGYRPAPGRGLVRHILESGFQAVIDHATIGFRQEAGREVIRQACQSGARLPCAPGGAAPTVRELARFCEELGLATHRYETPTGRSEQGVGWVTSRCGFLALADDLFTEALFEVVAAGLTVAAVGPCELLLEVLDGEGEDAVGNARQALEAAFARYTHSRVHVTHEGVELW